MAASATGYKPDPAGGSIHMMPNHCAMLNNMPATA